MTYFTAQKSRAQLPEFIDAGQSLLKVMDKRDHPLYSASCDNTGTSVVSCSKSEGFTLMPDSVEEFINLGYKEYKLKWYYHYNANYRLDTLFKYFYDANWNPDEITEFETYDSQGRLLKRIRRQRDQWAIFTEGDSSFVNYLLVDNTWENGRLVKEVRTYYTLLTDLYTIYHTYNDSGLLIQDSTVYGGESWTNTYYYYYPEGELWYECHKGDYSQVFYKYSYETTDTSRFTTFQRSYSFDPDIQIDVDTITQWDWKYTDYFLEYFNEEGKRISIMNSYLDEEGVEAIDYRAEYTYTGWGGIESARYYDWKSTAGGGTWEEATRIDWQYNEDRKIEFYDNWFWDAKIEDWAPENRKVYYYSLVSNELGIEGITTERINIFPNPAHEIIYLNYSKALSGTYSIVDIRGRLLKQGCLVQNQIAVRDLPAGLYFIEIITEQDRFGTRFIKL